MPTRACPDPAAATADEARWSSVTRLDAEASDGDRGLAPTKPEAGPDKAPAADSVRQYLAEIGRIPLLSPTEEVALARRLDAARLALQQALAACPPALAALRALAEDAARGALPLEALVADADGDGAAAGPGRATVASRRVRRLQHALTPRAGTDPRGRRPTVRELRQRLATGLLHPAVLDRLVAACRTAPPQGSADRRRLARLETRLEAVRELRHAFIAANLRLVVAVARRHQGRGLELLDLIQAGTLGLMKAVDRFRARRGFKFSTYAMWWIRQGISRALADQARTIRLPVHVGEKLSRLRHAAEALTQRLRREPAPAELARHLGLGPDRVERLLAAAPHPLSLEAPVGEDTTLDEFLEDRGTPAPDAGLAQQDLTTQLGRVLDTLPPREAEVLRLRFGLGGGEPQTLEQIGQRFGLTRERIRQIERKALRRLRHPSRRRRLAPFA